MTARQYASRLFYGALVITTCAVGVGVADETAVDFASARASHWAYRPVDKPPIPRVSRTPERAASIDHFILAKLE